MKVRETKAAFQGSIKLRWPLV